MVTTCALGGHAPFKTAAWTHWDSFQYLDISRRGYALFSCFLPSGLAAWCGNAAWLPAYPWVIRMIASFGLDHAVVGIALSWLFGLGTTVLLWVAFFPRVDFRATVAVLFAAFAPGLIYRYAVFPLSMLAFFTVLYLWLLSTERWLAAGLTGFVLVLTYPVGVAAPIAATVGLLAAYRGAPIRERAHRVALSVLPSIVAIGLLPVVQAQSTGHWNAFFLAQANYQHFLANPFERAFHASGLLFDLRLFTLANAPYAQTLLVTFATGCVLVALAFGHSRITPFQLLLGLWIVVTWLITQATTGASPYRGEAALLPMAILIGTLPRLLAGAIVASAIAIAIPLELLFLRNTLV